LAAQYDQVPGRDIFENPVHSRHASRRPQQPCEAANVKQSCASRALPPLKPPSIYPNVCLPLQTSCTTLPAPGRWLALFALLLYVRTMCSLRAAKASYALCARPRRACRANKYQETPLKRSAVQQRRGLAIHEYRSAALLESVRVSTARCPNFADTDI
jgi:hypothetical protein